MNELTCSKCGAKLSAGEPITQCTCGGIWQFGASDFNSSPTNYVSMLITEGTKEIAELAAGMSKSADGSFATIEQMVDRGNNRYKKKVTFANGTVVKDVDGSLKDQSLHGPQRA